MKEYLRSSAEVLEEVATSENGLTAAEAEKRLEQNGKNKLAEAKKKTALQKFFGQFKDVMILIS